MEGIRAVGEAIRTGQEIKHILYCPALLDSDFGNQQVEALSEGPCDVIEVNTEVFNSFALKDGPQGLAAVVAQRWAGLDEVGQTGGLWTALDAIQDPGNLGAVMRSTDAAGGEGIILIGQTTDPYHPSAVRASTGSIFTQKLIKTNLATLASWKRTSNYPVVGTFCGEAKHYREYNYPDRLILMMGSEQKGLQPDHLAICDDMVTIPMAGEVDSLNLSVAASIVLFEIFDQKGRKK